MLHNTIGGVLSVSTSGAKLIAHSQFVANRVLLAVTSFLRGWGTVVVRNKTTCARRRAVKPASCRRSSAASARARAVSACQARRSTCVELADCSFYSIAPSI